MLEGSWQEWGNDYPQCGLKEGLSNSQSCTEMEEVTLMGNELPILGGVQAGVR
jgi:hypothetical protein